MLQGDVGSGKTLVALFAMLHAVESGAQAALQRVGPGLEGGELGLVVDVVGLQEDVTTLDGAVGHSLLGQDLVEADGLAFEVRSDHVTDRSGFELGRLGFGLHGRRLQLDFRRIPGEAVGGQEGCVILGGLPVGAPLLELGLDGLAVVEARSDRNADVLEVTAGALGVLGLVLVGVVVIPDVAIGHFDLVIGDGGVALEHVAEIHLLLGPQELALAFQRVGGEAGLDETVKLLPHALQADDVGIAVVVGPAIGVAVHLAERLAPVLLLLLGHLPSVEGAGDPRGHEIPVADVVELLLGQLEAEVTELVAVQALGDDVAPGVDDQGMAVGPPAAGVIATSPATIPEARPSTVGLLSVSHSANIQAKAPMAADVLVTKKAEPATPSAAS